MGRLVLIALAFSTVQAHANQHVCFTISSITLSNMGQEIEHEITSPEDQDNPEFYLAFDLEAGTTTLFWVDPDGGKVREVNTLEKINELLYVGQYEVDSEKHYTTYHFQNDFGGGLLAEAHFVASFRCEQISMIAAEEKYSVPFSEFKSID